MINVQLECTISFLRSDEERRLFLGKNELTNYLREKKKRPQATMAVRLVNQSVC